MGEKALSLYYKLGILEVAVITQRDELVERCLRGDALVYKELYQRYSKAMFNTCLRMLNNVAEAEDVLPL